MIILKSFPGLLALDFVLFNCIVSDHHNGDLQTKSQGHLKKCGIWYTQSEMNLSFLRGGYWHQGII